MLEFDDAVQRVLEGVRTLGHERVFLPDAEGRVLAETLRAKAPLPPFDYSAMDGYAVRVADFSGSGPWTLPVRGESRTGGQLPSFAFGSACRIFTGARIPDGTDAIVMQEDVERSGDSATFRERPTKGNHVRHAGEDLAVGDVALEAGTRLGAAQLGLAAALDRPQLLVARSPVVTILATGDELRAPGEPPREGTIPDSNTVAIASLVRAAGGTPRLGPLTRDDAASTTHAIRQALGGSDLLVTIGGVSVGEHDVVRPALEEAGAKLDFWKVRIKPGKPLVSGRAGNTHILGLPGNPVSAQVTFLLFALPLLRAMQGDARPLPRYRQARLAKPVRQKPGRRGFYRAQFGPDDQIVPLDNQASGAPTSMAWAEALVVIPADSTGAEAGELVTILPLSTP